MYIVILVVRISGLKKEVTTSLVIEKKCVRQNMFSQRIDTGRWKMRTTIRINVALFEEKVEREGYFVNRTETKL